jgi:hypothetical protein
MPIAHSRTRPPWHLQRGYEGSRLEAQLIATAYELALPIRRQPLSRPHRSSNNAEAFLHSSRLRPEGVSA